MTAESFYEYICNIFYPWVVAQKIEFPIILYLDGHKSHVTLPLSEFCREKKIILISLPANSTHVMQPLDVGFFKPLKTSWKKATKKFKTDNPEKTLNKTNFAPILQQALNEISYLESIFKNAFRATGLFPFDPSHVDYEKLLPDVIQNNENSEDKVSKNLDIVGHLKFLESYIEPSIVTHFYNLRGEEWNETDENKGLYQTWYRIFQDSGLTFNEVLEEPSQVVIEVEDGLILEEGCEQLVQLEGENDVLVRKEAINDFDNEEHFDLNNREETKMDDEEIIEKISMIKDKEELRNDDKLSDITTPGTVSMDVNEIPVLRDLTNTNTRSSEETEIAPKQVTPEKVGNIPAQETDNGCKKNPKDLEKPSIYEKILPAN